MQGLPFKSEMTLANLAGNKTRTSWCRGLKKINQNPGEWELLSVTEGIAQFLHIPNDRLPETIRCPYGKVGDELYGKETYQRILTKQNQTITVYKDYIDNQIEGVLLSDIKWRSSMFMPEWASRYRIKLTRIDCQRIHEISEEDAIEEGIVKVGEITEEEAKDWGWNVGDLYGLPQWIKTPASCLIRYSAKEAFQSLWDLINKQSGHGWEVNPWVWVLYYDVIKKAVK